MSKILKLILKAFTSSDELLEALMIYETFKAKRGEIRSAADGTTVIIPQLRGVKIFGRRLNIGTTSGIPVEVVD